MINLWLTEIGEGFIWLIGQPLFYWAIVLTILTSYYRRKQERTDFGSSVYKSGTEWKRTWVLSVISGIVISASLIVTGAILSYPVWLLISVLSIIVTITGRLYLLSAGYLMGITVILLAVMQKYTLTIDELPSQWMEELMNISLPLILALTAVFLVIESILWFTADKEYAFPKLIKGKRGKYIGLHHVKRLSVVPVLVPVPGGAIDNVFSWWPLLPIGNHGYGLMLFPFLIGVQQAFQGHFSNQGGKLFGKWVLTLGLMTGIFAAGSFYDPLFIYIGAAVAILGRAIIQLYVRFVDRENTSIFRPQSDGLIILAVIKDSPADKMGLKTGERVEKVHQIPVANEIEFYDALQESRTFCKLEVRDVQGEIRFVQGPMYQGDHHELGLVFVKEKPRFRLYQDLPNHVV
ncbi:PDZ domain-containing protein [Virgibacillus sp. MSP4-1]|uniref:PDZ domain-containing protein n=1 Tax=Virgibacillus sp. MSP4-1 TaxID=2700081 RepID=UPI00039DC017|nr:PDZ domain-containing protein [Virgibacillus sp. MSP4-1]QHS23268.1 PDZ domain-containing protein [Virgibacillus sp. MSP4-1]